MTSNKKQTPEECLREIGEWAIMNVGSREADELSKLIGKLIDALLLDAVTASQKRRQI